jgi:hypothetical protein
MKTNLQNKWRLPTIDEFEKVLHPNQDSIPNFKNYSVYWSSSEYYSSGAWSFGFNYGGFAYFNSSKYSTEQVRAVRDVSPNSTNSSNSTIIGNLEVHNEDLGRMNWYDAVDAVEKLNYNKS